MCEKALTYSCSNINVFNKQMLEHAPEFRLGKEVHST